MCVRVRVCVRVCVCVCVCSNSVERAFPLLSYRFVDRPRRFWLLSGSPSSNRVQMTGKTTNKRSNTGILQAKQ